MARLPFDRDSAGELPRECGVYLFFGESGKPLYIGKAADLRARVRSYFQSGDERLVTRHIGGLAESMDCIVTGSVKEALILENSLIKKHKPRLNIRLKDDATYFSLRLDLHEPWPRLTIVRKRRKEDALYFGPYPSARACRRTLQHLNRIFPVRDCPDSVLNNRVRPCLSHEIGQCVAPCVGLVRREEYMEIVDRVVRFLSGKDEDVLKEVEAQMREAADSLDFERAADLRDRLKSMRETVANPLVARRGGPDRDVIGFHPVDDEASIAVLMVRDGLLVNSATFAFKILGRSAEEVIAAFLGQFYGEGRVPPAEVLLPCDCADLDLHREVLFDLRGSAVRLRVPERGEGRRLLDLAEENARQARRRSAGRAAEARDVLERLQSRLGLFRLPSRMECFDVSHLAGEDVVASRVTFVDGAPDKSSYRHFRLRDVQRNDDFAAMAEVLTRRLRRGRKEGDLPDLVVIDGGRPQLDRVMDVFRELRIAGVDVAGLAKARAPRAGRAAATAFERVYRPDSQTAIILPPDAPETRLLERLRNEAHRFAIAYQRRLRGKARIGTVLELIPGVGPGRAKALLAHFGSLAAVKGANRDALSAAPLFNPSLADAVLRFFAGKADLRED